MGSWGSWGGWEIRCFLLCTKKSTKSKTSRTELIRSLLLAWDVQLVKHSWFLLLLHLPLYLFHHSRLAIADLLRAIAGCWLRSCICIIDTWIWSVRAINFSTETIKSYDCCLLPPDPSQFSLLRARSQPPTDASASAIIDETNTFHLKIYNPCWVRVSPCVS